MLKKGDILSNSIPLGKILPIIVHFFLRLAIYLKRNGFVEFENRNAVESKKSLCSTILLLSHYIKNSIAEMSCQGGDPDRPVL